MPESPEPPVASGDVTASIAAESTASRKYTIRQVLGSGGFGTVYRADMEAGGVTTPVALKVLHPHLAEPEDLARFRDEARLLASVRHRALVRVQAMIPVQDRWAIVLEYVPGASLVQIRRLGAVPVSVALEIVEEVASALHAAWEGTELVHRDIKLSNLQLTTSGEVKLLDFGIAKAEMEDREARTEAGQVLGTLKYMSPERLQGESGHASDVYALGMVFLELVLGTGREPLAWLAPARHAAKIEDLGRHVGELEGSHPTVGAWLVRLLSHDPKRRPPAAEMADTARALSRATTGPSLRSFARENVPRVPRPTDRQDAWVGTTVTETVDVRGTTRTPSRWPLWVGLGVAVVALTAGGLLALGGGAGMVAGLVASQGNPQAAAPRRVVRPVAAGAADERDPDIHPDGDRIVWVRGKERLNVQPIDGGLAEQLPRAGGPDAVHGPRYSPDGEWLSFGGEGSIWVMPADGGKVRAVGQGQWATWFPSGEELLVTVTAPGDPKRGELVRLSLDGERTPLRTRAPVQWVDVGSSGDIALGLVDGGMVRVDLDSGALTELPIDGLDAPLASLFWQGEYVYLSLWRTRVPDLARVPVDASGKPTGPLETVQAGAGAMSMSADATGRVAWTRRSLTGQAWWVEDDELVVYDEAGTDLFVAQLSPDGRRIVYAAWVEDPEMPVGGGLKLFLDVGDGSRHRPLDLPMLHSLGFQGWEDGGNILISDSSKQHTSQLEGLGADGLFRMPVDGGEPEQIAPMPVGFDYIHGVPGLGLVVAVHKDDGALVVARDGASLLDAYAEQRETAPRGWTATEVGPDGTWLVVERMDGGDLGIWDFEGSVRPLPVGTDAAAFTGPSTLWTFRERQLVHTTLEGEVDRTLPVPPVEGATISHGGGRTLVNIWYRPVDVMLSVPEASD